MTLCLASLTLSAVRDTIGTGIYFMTYESSKQLLSKLSDDSSQSSNPLAVLVAGGLCGIVSWAMICEYTLCFHVNSLAAI